MREKTLEEIKTILKRYGCFDTVDWYLFGSWARGEEKASSDIDIAIDYKNGLPAGTLSYIREVFEESTIPYKVEIVDLTKTDESFRNKVIKEGKRWNVCGND